MNTEDRTGDSGEKSPGALDGVKTHPLVENASAALRASLEGSVVLRGFLQKLSSDGLWRLYLSIELDEYIDFNEVDVLFHQALEPTVDPLAASLLWLKRDAVVKRASVRRLRVSALDQQARFLRGRIMGQRKSLPYRASSNPMSAGLRPPGQWPWQITCGQECTCGWDCTYNDDCDSYASGCPK